MAGRVEEVEAAVAEIVNRAYAADDEVSGVEVELVDVPASECGREDGASGAWAGRL